MLLKHSEMKYEHQSFCRFLPQFLPVFHWRKHSFALAKTQPCCAKQQEFPNWEFLIFCKQNEIVFEKCETITQACKNILSYSCRRINPVMLILVVASKIHHKNYVKYKNNNTQHFRLSQWQPPSTSCWELPQLPTMFVTQRMMSNDENRVCVVSWCYKSAAWWQCKYPSLVSIHQIHLSNACQSPVDKHTQ